MKRFLLILTILVLIAFSISIISCGSDSDDTSSDTSSTNTDTDTNPLFGYVEHISGDYFYCDSVVVADKEMTKSCRGGLGSAGTLSSSALENHGKNIVLDTTHYLVCSFAGRLSESTYIKPKLEIFSIDQNMTRYNYDAVSIDEGENVTVDGYVFKPDGSQGRYGDKLEIHPYPYNFDVSIYSFEQGGSTSFMTTLVIPFTVKHSGDLYVRFYADCPSLADSESYYVEKSFKRVSVESDKYTNTSVNVDKLSVNFLSQEKYTLGNYTDSDLTSTPSFDRYDNEYAVIDLDLTCVDKNGAINVIIHFPCYRYIDVTVEDIPTSNIKIFQKKSTTSDRESLIIIAGFDNLFGDRDKASIRIILELAPIKSEAERMSVFVSGDYNGYKTYVTGTTCTSIEFDTTAQPIEYVLSEDKSYYIAYKRKTFSTNVIILDTYNGIPVREIKPKMLQENDIGVHNRTLESIVIGNNITSLPERVFENCFALKNVTFGSGITSLPRKAFLNCTALESITIPKEITVIPEECFYGCTSLKSITFEGEISRVANGAFSGCKSLESIKFTSALGYISDNAFYGCESLISVIIEPTTNERLKICALAFGGCTSLKEVWLRPGTWYTYWTFDLSITGSFEVTSYEDAASLLKDTYCEKYICANDK